MFKRPYVRVLVVLLHYYYTSPNIVKPPRNSVDPFIIHITLVILRNMSIPLLCSPCSSQSLTRCRTGNKPNNFHIWTSEEMCKVSDKKLWIIDWTDLGGDTGPPIKPIPGMLNEFVNRCELATSHYSYNSHHSMPPGLGYTCLHFISGVSCPCYCTFWSESANFCIFLSRFLHFLGLVHRLRCLD